MLSIPSIDKDIPFPAVIQPNDDITPGNFLKVLASEKESVRKYLTKAGAIHFKGFRQSLDSFDPFMETLFGDRKPFSSDQPGIFTKGRKVMANNVVETTYLNKKLPMTMHNEFSYLPTFPSFIGFRCLKAPTTGGETAIADCRKIYEEIDPTIRRRFEVKYTRNLYSKRLLSELANKFIKVDESWMEVFGTNNKSEVEKICGQNQLTYSWGTNDLIKIENILPAIRKHPVSGEAVWFNVATSMLKHPTFIGWSAYLAFRFLYPSPSIVPSYCSYGDGTNISYEEISHVKEITDRNTIKIKWCEGDTLILDNYLSAHKRMPYTGERVLVGALRG